MTMPVFSVIIPTLNRPLELTECLRALSSLEYPKERFEIIVVDDGSRMPLDDTVAEFTGTVSIRLVRQSCGGPAAARNAGVSISRGRYLAFTDDDCIPERGWLSAFERLLRADSCILAGGRVLNALPDNAYATASQMIVDFVRDYYQSGRGTPRFFAANNVAMHVDTFHQMGGFSPIFRTSEDRDFCDRWLAAGYRLVYAPDAMIYHAHRQDLGSFWKQHLGYGRGACRFFKAYASRHNGDSSIEPNFYWTLARELPGMISQHNRNRVLLFSLMALWQIANFAGFLTEAVSSQRLVCKGIEPL
jgi:glycosyltransferase involved in cell wall biosynthesis